MIATLLLASVLMKTPPPKVPDIIIGIVGISKSYGLHVEGESLLVYEPGVLAVRLNPSLSLRPHVTLRHGTETGNSISAGVQFVWTRRR